MRIYHYTLLEGLAHNRKRMTTVWQQILNGEAITPIKLTKEAKDVALLIELNRLGDYTDMPIRAVRYAAIHTNSEALLLAEIALKYMPRRAVARVKIRKNKLVSPKQLYIAISRLRENRIVWSYRLTQARKYEHWPQWWNGKQFRFHPAPTSDWSGK